MLKLFVYVKTVQGDELLNKAIAIILGCLLAVLRWRIPVLYANEIPIFDSSS